MFSHSDFDSPDRNLNPSSEPERSGIGLRKDLKKDFPTKEVLFISAGY
jgi:hypothetical protein